MKIIWKSPVTCKFLRNSSFLNYNIVEYCFYIDCCMKAWLSWCLHCYFWKSHMLYESIINLTFFPVFAYCVALNWSKVLNFVLNFLVCILYALRKYILSFKVIPNPVPLLYNPLKWLHNAEITSVHLKEHIFLSTKSPNLIWESFKAPSIYRKYGTISALFDSSFAVHCSLRDRKVWPRDVIVVT